MERLEFAQERMLEADMDEELFRGVSVWGAGVDLQDGFYQNLNSGLCDYLGFDFPKESQVNHFYEQTPA